MDKRVLIVEDDPQIAHLVATNLEDLGFVVDTRGDGGEGLDAALKNEYELVILDVMLPGLDGFEVCRRIRQEKGSLPVLMLTAKASVANRVLGLEVGADDYLIKPFSIDELIARVKALLRRSFCEEGQADGGQLTQGKIVVGDLTIDPNKREVSVGENSVTLTSKEFDLLAFLASHSGQCFTRQQLLDQVWCYHHAGYEHTVSSHINRLRAKIENDPSSPKYILTVYGYGYRFAEPSEFESGGS